MQHLVDSCMEGPGFCSVPQIGPWARCYCARSYKVVPHTRQVASGCHQLGLSLLVCTLSGVHSRCCAYLGAHLRDFCSKAIARALLHLFCLTFARERIRRNPHIFCCGYSTCSCVSCKSRRLTAHAIEFGQLLLNYIASAMLPCLPWLFAAFETCLDGCLEGPGPVKRE